jgi:hypothetical protein
LEYYSKKALTTAQRGRVGGEGIHEGRWTNVKIEATQDRVTVVAILKGA